MSAAAVGPVVTPGQPFHLADEAAHHPDSPTLIGFWLYIMSDCLIFAALFAIYAVLGRNYAGGPRPSQLFELPKVALATSMLLFSSLTYGYAMLSMAAGKSRAMLGWLAATGVLGLVFVGLELAEFAHLIAEGAGPQRSAFLSSFFTLVGVHGLHVSVGVLWLVVLMTQVRLRGLGPEMRRRLMCLSMFWHFLDVVWIGVFSFVYLIGVL